MPPQEKSKKQYDDIHWQEDFDELAGKLEFLAGMTRDEAESKARKMLERKYGLPQLDLL